MNGNKMGASERMQLVKRRTRRFEFYLRGHFEVRKYRKGASEPYETVMRKNTIEAVGFDLFLNVVSGLNTTGHADANAAIQLLSSVDAIVRTFLTAEAGPVAGTDTKLEPAATYTWEWHDDTNESYTFRKLAFWNEDPATGIKFSTFAFAADELKPSTERWHYIYNLELYSTDADFAGGGFLRMLDVFSGNQTTNPFTAANVYLRPVNSANAELSKNATEGAVDQAAGSRTVDTAANKITWVWTVLDGNYNGEWAKTKVKHNNGALKQDLRFGGCKTDGTSCGTKAGGEEWEYTYEFSIAQGS